MSEAATHVAVHHPETGGDWMCPVGYLETAKEDGWQLAGDVASGELASAYDGWTNPQLSEEISKRNADPVDPEADPLPTSGNKPELLATLIADDARRGPAGSDS